MKDIKNQAKASNAKKASAITGGPLKHSAHAQLGMKCGGSVRDNCADGGPVKGGCASGGKVSKGGCKK